MMPSRYNTARLICAVLVFASLIAGCGDNRNWSHPCDPTYGSLIPITLDMVALEGDCRISTEFGLLDPAGPYLYCGDYSSHGWCAPFLDFKIDSTYNLVRDINGDLPDLIVKATLDLKLIWKGGGRIDVLAWRDRAVIPSPSDIEVPADSWWKLASFADDGNVNRHITLDLSTEPLEWLLNNSEGSFTGIILFPRGCTRGPDWHEGYWIIPTTDTPYLQIIAARMRD